MRALLLFTMFAASAPSLAALLACNETAKQTISFRTATSRDTVTVTIRGNPCHEALLSIQITSDTGKPLYSYEAPFKKHVATHWEDPGLPADAEKLAKRIAAQDEKKTTENLPPWLPEADYYEEYYDVIMVSQDQYEQLKKQKRPIFTHPTHYEQWKSVIYDPGTGKAQLLFEGGL
jgi:hypothetical protein